MAKQLRLLILDDEPIVGKRLAPALNRLGCEIETFEDRKRLSNDFKKKSSTSWSRMSGWTISTACRSSRRF